MKRKWNMFVATLAMTAVLGTGYMAAAPVQSFAEEAVAVEEMTTTAKTPEERIHIEVVEDLVEIEDEEVPQANLMLDHSAMLTRNTRWGILAGVCAAFVAILAWLFGSSRLREHRVTYSNKVSATMMDDIIKIDKK